MIRRPPRSTLFPSRRSSDLDLSVLILDLQVVIPERGPCRLDLSRALPDRKSTRLNSSHLVISYAVFCLKKKNMRDPLPPTSFRLIVLAITSPLEVVCCTDAA